MGIGEIARGKKSLIFVESPSRAERIAHALAGTHVEVFIHHSSVSRADRTLAEEQFARGQNTAIVCTSTMELGIDVGDLDQVIQLDAPSSVASFLQRLGRTGRRSHARSNCKFFCLSSESLLQSIALLRLAEAGWVEDCHFGNYLRMTEGYLRMQYVRIWFRPNENRHSAASVPNGSYSPRWSPG